MSQMSESEYFKSEAEYALFDSDVRNMVELVEGAEIDSPFIHGLGASDEYKDHIFNHQQTVSVPIIPVPTSLPSVICNDEYNGPYNFEVSVIPSGKNPWVFSHSLKKIFIDMGSPFPLDFKISQNPNCQLYVRAMPVFSSSQHSQDLVYRCINHEHAVEKSNLDIPENVRQHVIRCQNSNAVYFGSKENNDRLSVVVPLAKPQPGTDSVREMFVFVCKSSCPSGMNRRPIEVIFTLENEEGQVMGRKVMNVRICSCPKRDKEKEEKELDKSPSDQENPANKKRKREKASLVAFRQCDTREYHLDLTIVGSQNVEKVLNYCHDLMAGEIMRNSQTSAEERFRKCLLLLSAQLEDRNQSS